MVNIITIPDENICGLCLNRSSCKQRDDNVPFSRSQQPLLCFQDYISLPCQSDNEILITTEQLSDCRKWRHQHPPKIQLGNSFKRRIFCLFLLPPTVIFFLLRKMTAGVQCFFFFPCKCIVWFSSLILNGWE